MDNDLERPSGQPALAVPAEPASGLVPSGFDQAHGVAFLHEAARYFEGRQTDGEDAAHWANVYNAVNCREAADMIEFLLAELRAMSGYLLNAKVDLVTGCPKATAIRTIEGGLKRVRSAIAKATGAA